MIEVTMRVRDTLRARRVKFSTCWTIFLHTHSEILVHLKRSKILILSLSHGYVLAHHSLTQLIQMLFLPNWLQENVFMRQNHTPELNISSIYSSCMWFCHNRGCFIYTFPLNYPFPTINFYRTIRQIVDINNQFCTFERIYAEDKKKSYC